MIKDCCCSVTHLCRTLLRPHGLQHARPPYPSPSPEVCPNSRPLHWWYHPASSDALFSFCPQSFPESGAFPMSQLFMSDDQNTGASASASVFPASIQGWFPLRLIGLWLRNWSQGELCGHLWMNECRVTQLCLTLCDCSLPGSSFLGILQPRILEWDPTPWDLPNPGIKPVSLVSPALAGFFTTSRSGHLWGRDK